MNPALALPLALALPWSPVVVEPPVHDVGRSVAVPAAAEAVWPLDPTSVLAPFDPPETTWSGGHRGVDLAGSPGAPVRSALPGTVSFAGLLAGRGVVVVDHGGRRTTYEPVLPWVRVGEVVTAGQPLGVLSTEPGHCAPKTCLHWGLRAGEVYLDPLALLGGREVRLLPVGPPETQARG